MKKILFFILIYILTTLGLTALIACFFVLYPSSLSEAAYITASLRTIDVFIYSCLSLLPFVSVLSLVLMVLRLIKTGSCTILEFLGYIFLYLVVWLIIIPSCIFYQPEQRVSQFITGQTHSSVAVFFESGTTEALAENLQGQYLSPPVIAVEIFSDLLFLRDIGRSAGAEGRIGYLLFASMGIALAALYSLCSISKWKLINVAIVLLLWCTIVWCNIEIYKRNWDFAFDTKWFVLIVNALLFFVISLIGMVNSIMQRKVGKGVK